MADVIVRVIGDTSSLNRALDKASGSTKAFERSATTMRGTISGLGSSILRTAAAFGGAYGLEQVMSRSVRAADDLQKAHRSLAVVIERNRGSVAASIPLIDQWASSQAKFGVSALEAERGLGRLAVMTGSVQEGMKGYDMALVISKATGKDFNAVSLAVAKAMEGQTTALARYIGKMPAGISQQELYTRVMGKFGGQAAANSDVMDKLRATVSNLEIKIGQALLPTVERLAGKLDAWLSKSENQKKITDAVKTAIDGLTSAVKVLVPILQKLAGGAGSVKDALGGWKNTLELLAAVKVASVLGGWTTAFSRLIGNRGPGGGGILGAVYTMGLLIAAWDAYEAKKIGSDIFGSGSNAGETQYVGASYKGQFLTALGGTSVAQLLLSAIKGELTKQTASAFSTALGSGQYGVYPTKAAAAAALGSSNLSVLSKISTTAGTQRADYYTEAQMAGLLQAQGLPAGAAQILAHIGYAGESGGKATAMGVNKNGTFDYGLFQINSGWKPSTMTDAQWRKWLSNPANNAQMAATILGKQGFGAWTEKYGAAAAAEFPKGSQAWNMLMGAGSPFGTPTATAVSASTDPKKKVASAHKVLLDWIGKLNEGIDTWANVVKNDRTVGDSPARINVDLKKQLGAVNAAISQVRAKIDAGGKDPALEKELHHLQSEHGSLQAQIIANTKKSADLIKKAAADAAWSKATQQVEILNTIAQYLPAQAGQIAAQTHDIIWNAGKALGDTADVIGAKQNWFESAISRAQVAYQAAVSRFQAAWSTLVSAATSALGNLYFQGGLQTPSEALLSQMQAEDQRQQMLDQLAEAKASGDAKAIRQAQRQYDEYELGLKAQEERRQADLAYQQATQQLTAALTALEPKIENGTATLGDFQAVMAQFGIQTTPELQAAFEATQATLDGPDGVIATFAALQKAIDDFITWLYARLGGGRAGASTTGTTANFMYPTPGTVLPQPGGGSYTVGNIIGPGQIVYMQHGGTGIVTKPTVFVAGEGGPEAFMFKPLSTSTGPVGASGNDGLAEIHTHVYLDGRQISETVRKELLRGQRRGTPVTV